MEFPGDSSIHFFQSQCSDGQDVHLHACLPYDHSSDHGIIDSKIDTFVSRVYTNFEARDWKGFRLNLQALRSTLRLKSKLDPEVRKRLVLLIYQAFPHVSESSEAEEILNVYCKLIRNKNGYYIKRSDLILDWQPLLDIFVNLFTSPFKTVTSSIWVEWKELLIEFVRVSRYYFSPASRREIIEKVVPMFNLSAFESNINGAIRSLSLICLFLPTCNVGNGDVKADTATWLPVIFQLWSYVNNSSALTSLMLNLFSRLACDSLAEGYNFDESGYGIFSVPQGKKIITRFSSLVHVPIAGALQQDMDPAHVQIFGQHSGRFEKNVNYSFSIARLVTYSLKSSDLNSSQGILTDMCQFIKSIKPILHPSNYTESKKPLVELLKWLAYMILMRRNLEKDGRIMIPLKDQLDQKVIDRIVRVLRDAALVSIYDTKSEILLLSGECIRYLSHLAPDVVLPASLKRIYPSMLNVIESRRTYAAFELLRNSVQSLISNEKYAPHILPLLELSIPGIDTNDLDKTTVCMDFIKSVFQLMPFHDVSDGTSQDISSDYIHSHIQYLEDAACDDITLPEPSLDLDEEENFDAGSAFKILSKSSSAGFRGMVIECYDRILFFINNGAEHVDSNLNSLLRAALLHILSSVSRELRLILIDKSIKFIEEAPWFSLAQAEILISTLLVERDYFLQAFLPHCLATIEQEILEVKAGTNRGSSKKNVLPKDRILIWYLRLLNIISTSCGPCPQTVKSKIVKVFDIAQNCLKGYAAALASSIFSRWLIGLCEIYTIDRFVLDNENISSARIMAQWGEPYHLSPENIKWHVPSRNDLLDATSLFYKWVNSCFEKLDQFQIEMENNKLSKLSSDMSHDICLFLGFMADASSGIGNLLVSFHSRAEPDNEHPDPSELSIYLRYCSYQTDNIPIEVGQSYILNLLSKDEYSELSKTYMRIGTYLLNICNKLNCDFPDEISCIQSAIKSLDAWLKGPTVKMSQRIGDEQWCKKDVRTFSIPAVRHYLPRSTMINKLYNYHHLRQILAETHSLNTVIQEIISAIIKTNRSVYSAIRADSQTVLRWIQETYYESLTILVPSVIEDLSSLEKERLSAALYLLNESNGLLCVFGGIWSLKITAFNAILKALEFDHSSLKKFAYGFFPNFAHIRHFRKENEYFDAKINNYKELIIDEQSVKKIAHQVELAIMTNNENIADYLDKLPEVITGVHWRQLVLIISLVSTTLNLNDKTPHLNLVQILGDMAVHDHTAPRSLCIVILASLLPHIWAQSRIPRIANICFEKLNDIGSHEIDVPNEFLENKQNYKDWLLSQDRELLVSNHSLGWLTWPSHLPLVKKDIHWSLHENVNSPALTEMIDCIGRILSKTWFEKLQKYLKMEPRNSDQDTNPKLRSQVIIFLAYIWPFFNQDSPSFGEIRDLVETLLHESSDKYAQRFGIEILVSLFNTPLCQSLEHRQLVSQTFVPIVKSCITSRLTPVNVMMWKGFTMRIFAESDLLKFPELAMLLDNLQPDLESDRAFQSSALLALKRKYIAALDSDYHLSKYYSEFLIEHIDNSYKKVRTEVGNSLFQILRAVYFPSFSSIDDLFAKCRSSSESIPCTRFLHSELLHHILEKFRCGLSESRCLEEKRPNYTKMSKTFLAFMQQNADFLDSSMFYEESSPWLIAELLNMLDINDDPELKSQAASLLLRLANTLHTPMIINNFVSSFERELDPSRPWHHRSYMCPVLISLLWRHQFSMIAETRSQVIYIVRRLLVDLQTEVRQAATDAFSAILTCFYQNDENTIAEFVSEFENVLLNTHPKFLRSTDDFSLQDKSDVAERHGALLGLSAILSTRSYDPPPTWLPKVVLMISRSCGEPNPLGKSARERMDIFRKLRSDTWHLDKRVFTANELEEISGINFHNYFV